MKVSIGNGRLSGDRASLTTLDWRFSPKVPPGLSRFFNRLGSHAAGCALSHAGLGTRVAVYRELLSIIDPGGPLVLGIIARSFDIGQPSVGFVRVRQGFIRVDLRANLRK